MRQKTWVILLVCALLVFGALPQSALAAGSYDLWVFGTQVTDANAADIRGDGTVYFDAATNTLTLNGVSWTGTATTPVSGSVNAAIYAGNGISTLTVNVTGTNSITTSQFGSVTAGIFAEQNIVFVGSGSLKIYAMGLMSEASAVYSRFGNVTFNSGSYELNGEGTNASFGVFLNSTTGVATVNCPSMTLMAGSVRSNQLGAAGAAVHGSLSVPEGSTVKASLYPAGTEEAVYVPGNTYKYLQITVPVIVTPEYDADGFQTNGNGYQPAQKQGDVYQIANAGNLFWFAQQVMSSTEGTAVNGVLTADIVIPAGRDWTPIHVDLGNQNWSPYTGTFDGAGKTISGMHVSVEGTAAAMFRSLSDTAVVKNLGIVDGSFSCTRQLLRRCNCGPQQRQN